MQWFIYNCCMQHTAIIVKFLQGANNYCTIFCVQHAAIIAANHFYLQQVIADTVKINCTILQHDTVRHVYFDPPCGIAVDSC